MEATGFDTYSSFVNVERAAWPRFWSGPAEAVPAFYTTRFIGFPSRHFVEWATQRARSCSADPQAVISALFENEAGGDRRLKDDYAEAFLRAGENRSLFEEVQHHHLLAGTTALLLFDVRHTIYRLNYIGVLRLLEPPLRSQVRRTLAAQLGLYARNQALRTCVEPILEGVHHGLRAFYGPLEMPPFRYYAQIEDQYGPAAREAAVLVAEALGILAAEEAIASSVVSRAAKSALEQLDYCALFPSLQDSHHAFVVALRDLTLDDGAPTQTASLWNRLRALIPIVSRIPWTTGSLIVRQAVRPQILSLALRLARPGRARHPSTRERGSGALPLPGIRLYHPESGSQLAFDPRASIAGAKGGYHTPLEPQLDESAWRAAHRRIVALHFLMEHVLAARRGAKGVAHMSRMLEWMPSLHHSIAAVDHIRTAAANLCVDGKEHVIESEKDSFRIGSTLRFAEWWYEAHLRLVELVDSLAPTDQAEVWRWIDAHYMHGV